MQAAFFVSLMVSRPVALCRILRLKPLLSSALALIAVNLSKKDVHNLLKTMRIAAEQTQ